MFGHGKTEKPLDISYTIEELSQFVKDFMAALDIEKAHIVGYSLGGAIGMRLVLNHTTAVDKLVLVSGGGLGREVHMLFRILTLPFLPEMATLPSRSGSATLLRMFVNDPTTITDGYVECHYQMSALPNLQKSGLKALRVAPQLSVDVRERTNFTVKSAKFAKN